ncbi:MAG: hypothetical protein HDT44_08510 [Ruminococcaceae bacterium]|nr:hypothetical protein [Oscillospiraceae bacterium]
MKDYFKEYGILDYFKEYGAEDAPSFLDFCQKEPYNGKDRIVNFLRNNGKEIGTSVKLSVDRITGERIDGEYNIVHYSDGKYSWCSDLAYHVNKYNLRLPKEFEDYVLNHS